MGPALYVDIDADLFSSTWTALDWLFREGLMKPGTVIGYVLYLHHLPAAQPTTQAACLNAGAHSHRHVRIHTLHVRFSFSLAQDDFWDLACKHKSPHIERYGEARAHAKIAAKHLVTFACICGPCGPLPPRGDAPSAMLPWGWRTYFVVVSIGTQASSGLTISMADANEFIHYSPTCRGLWDRNSSHWLGLSRR